MSKEVKLALCPFCGGKAELKHGGSIGLADKPRFSYVECTKCHTRTVSFEISTEYSSDEQAIERWNNRSTPELDLCYKHDVYTALQTWFDDESDLRHFDEVLKSIPTIKFTPKGCY